MFKYYFFVSTEKVGDATEGGHSGIKGSIWARLILYRWIGDSVLILLKAWILGWWEVCISISLGKLFYWIYYNFCVAIMVFFDKYIIDVFSYKRNWFSVVKSYFLDWFFCLRIIIVPIINLLMPGNKKGASPLQRNSYAWKNSIDNS